MKIKAAILALLLLSTATSAGVFPFSFWKPSLLVSCSGCTITHSGGNNIYTFDGSGSFSVSGATVSCNLLVVAGGASGASSYFSGGGGGGGLCQQTGRTISSGTYTVTVGAGGIIPSNAQPGNNGGDSVFDTVIANGGGAGAAFTGTQENGGTGGSGGGAASNIGGLGGLTNQTNSGGATCVGFPGGASSNNSGGGGGGAGGVGSVGDPTNPVRVSGGPGVSNSISGSSVTYAAGGRGGGNGGVTANSGAANTGTGGDSGDANISASGAGGSGVVIVSCPI